MKRFLKACRFYTANTDRRWSWCWYEAGRKVKNGECAYLQACERGEYF